MAHNDPLFPGGKWPPHIVPTPGILDKLDQRTAEGLNGVGGGIYAPSSPIHIGGAGVRVRGASSLLNGPLRTERGGRIVLAPSVYPTFPTPRTRRVVVPLHWVDDFAPYDNSGGALEGNYTHVLDPYYGVRAGTSGRTFLVSIPALRLHQGATALYFRLKFRVHDRSPELFQSSFPWFRIQRVPATGGLSSYTPNLSELFELKPWQANAHYQVGDMIHSTNGGFWNGSNAYAYRCVVAGQTTGTEPTWPTTLGNNYINNTVTWRVEGGWTNPYNHNATPIYPIGMDPDVYFNKGLPQEIALKVNLNATLDPATYNYQALISDPGTQDITYHSIVVEMGNITDFREH